MGKAFSCRKLAKLTFFRAEKIHLSRVVSAVKDELRPPKEVIYWTPCYCCTNKVAQNGWKIHQKIAYPFTLANKTFSYDFHTLWTPVPFCNFSTQSNFAKNVVGAASFFSIIPNCFQRQFYRQNWRFFEFDLPDNNRACFFRKKDLCNVCNLGRRKLRCALPSLSLIGLIDFHGPVALAFF